MQTPNQKYIAFQMLLDFFGGNRQQLSYSLNVHYQTVVGWQKRGQVSRKGALLIDQRTDIPFTKQSLRPDLFQ